MVAGSGRQAAAGRGDRSRWPLLLLRWKALQAAVVLGLGGRLGLGSSGAGRRSTSCGAVAARRPGSFKRHGAVVSVSFSRIWSNRARGWAGTDGAGRTHFGDAPDLGFVLGRVKSGPGRIRAFASSRKGWE